MGGIIIWGTVGAMAFLILILSNLFDGFWNYLNFVDRAQTYLPLAAMLVAGALGMVDDIFGVLRMGPNSGGLRVSQKLVVYIFLALI